MWYVSFVYKGKQIRRSCGTSNRDEAYSQGLRIRQRIIDPRRSARTHQNRAKLDLPDELQEWSDNVVRAARSASSWLGLLHRRALDRSRKADRPFLLTREQLIEVALRSGGCCELTGITFSWQREAGVRMPPFAPSLDRIDYTAPYQIKNVRLVCTCVNAALGQWGDRVFWSMVSQAAKKRPGDGPCPDATVVQSMYPH